MRPNPEMARSSGGCDQLGSSLCCRALISLLCWPPMVAVDYSRRVQLLYSHPILLNHPKSLAHFQCANCVGVGVFRLQVLIFQSQSENFLS